MYPFGCGIGDGGICPAGIEGFCHPPPIIGFSKPELMAAVLNSCNRCLANVALLAHSILANMSGINILNTGRLLIFK